MKSDASNNNSNTVSFMWRLQQFVTLLLGIIVVSVGWMTLQSNATDRELQRESIVVATVKEQQVTMSNIITESKLEATFSSGTSGDSLSIDKRNQELPKASSAIMIAKEKQAMSNSGDTKSKPEAASSSRIDSSIEEVKEPKAAAPSSSSEKSNKGGKQQNNKKPKSKRKRLPVCEMVANMTATEQLLQDLLTNKNRTKLPTPIINVGMNKMGSTSLNVFMKCSKQFNTTHYGCGPLTLAENSKKERYTRATVPCGKCIHEALQDRVKKHAPLAACGGVSDSNPTGFNSFMQLDYNRGEDECIFPQMTALEEIHREYPHATLILLSRPLNDWINSVNHWQDLRQRFIDCNYEDLPTGKGRNPFQLQSWVCNHIARVRQFVKDHPTHALIELNLYDTKQADYYLSRLLIGASQGTKCFGKANQGDKQEEKKKSK